MLGLVQQVVAVEVDSGVLVRGVDPGGEAQHEVEEHGGGGFTLDPQRQRALHQYPDDM